MKRILLPLIAAGALLGSHVAIADGEALFKSKPCAACHAIDKKLVGPSMQEVAAKYDGQDGAVELVAGHIKNGVSGIWGPIPMPANQVTEEEATLLAEWALSLK